MPDGTIGVPDIRDAERLQGFPAKWSTPAEEVASPRFRWRLVGNAVTVEVAEWLGTRIAKMDGSGQTRTNTATTWKGTGWPSAAYGEPCGHRTPVISSEWPVCRKRENLAAFLRYPLEPLSYKAAEGFRTRLAKSRLHYEKDFMRDLERHCDRMRRASNRGDQ